MTDYQATAKRHALVWLNSFGGDELPEDYFTDAVVRSDTGDLSGYGGRVMVFEMHSDDDGGPAWMVVYFDEQDDVQWSAWYYDGTWGEMKEVK